MLQCSNHPTVHLALAFCSFGLRPNYKFRAAMLLRERQFFAEQVGSVLLTFAAVCLFVTVAWSVSYRHRGGIHRQTAWLCKLDEATSSLTLLVARNEGRGIGMGTIAALGRHATSIYGAMSCL